ncbi:MAG: hypothetical protein ACKODX_02335, partial [Gemmata sp.]
MRWSAPLVPLALALATTAVPSPAEDRQPGARAGADTVTVFTNATIYTAADDKPLEKASLAVKGGKIIAV